MEAIGSDDNLWKLAVELGSSWTRIGSCLQISHARIENLQDENPHNAHERAYQMLRRWKDATKPSEWVEQLRDAFRNAERLDLMPFLDPSNSTGRHGTINVDAFILKLKSFVKRKMSKLPLIPWVSTGCVNIDQVFVNVQLLINITTASFPCRLPMTSHNAIFEDIKVMGLVDLSSTRILLLGRTGSGKTTLLTKYAYDWCMKKEGALLTDVPVVFILPMRKLDQWSNLGQAVLDHMLPTENQISAVEIENFCESHPDDVVILLDGYDEFRGKGLNPKDCGNIAKMLRNECFTECRVVVSSRPARVGDFHGEYESYRHLEITGLTSEDVDEYVYKVFNGNHIDLGKKLLDYLEENQLKSELASLPLMLTAFCQLAKWTDGRDFGELNSISKLFDRLIECMFTHQQSKMASKPCASSSSSSIASEDLVLELGKVAVEGFLGRDEEELIFSEDDFHFRCTNSPEVIRQGLETGLLCKYEDYKIRPQSYQELSLKRHKLPPKRNISFVLKTLQEKCGGNYLAHLLQVGDKNSEEAFSTYLRRIRTDQKVIDLANILMFASAANVKAATRIMCHVLLIFQEQTRCMNEKRQFRECQNLQRLIEICFQLNFESGSEGCFNHLINGLLGKGRLLRFLGVPSYVAKSIGYLLAHSCQRSQSESTIYSDGENVLCIRSLELICICLDWSSIQFRDLFNNYPGIEKQINNYMIESTNSQSHNLHKLRKKVQASGQDVPSYLNDHSDFAFFAIIPIWQEITERQHSDFILRFVLTGLEQLNLLEELVLNGVKAENSEWIKLFNMIENHAFPKMTRLTLSLNDLAFGQTALLSSAMSSTPKLKYINLAGNQIDEDFVVNLPQLLRLESLILDKTSLPSRAIVQLTKRVHLYPCLQKLDMVRNQDTDDKAVSSIFEAFEISKQNWKELRLSLYKVTTGGLDIFERKIIHAATLTHLSLVHSPIPERVIQCCASVLTSLPELVDLRISGISSSSSENDFMCSSETVEILTRELGNHRRLSFLSILYTRMSPSDFLKLLRSCGDHSSLKTFRFSRPFLPPDAEVERECKKAHKTFLVLWI